MSDRNEKHHTPAYEYLNAVAGRLHSQWSKVSQLDRRNSDDVRNAVQRQSCREWDEAIVKATNGFPLNDICAAVARLKDGKLWLTFLDTPQHQKAA